MSYVIDHSNRDLCIVDIESMDNIIIKIWNIKTNLIRENIHLYWPILNCFY